jgi:hypothetical protein
LSRSDPDRQSPSEENDALGIAGVFKPIEIGAAWKDADPDLPSCSLRSPNNAKLK